MVKIALLFPDFVKFHSIVTRMAKSVDARCGEDTTICLCLSLLIVNYMAANYSTSPTMASISKI